ncbi:uncharacterized protein FOMMEDRAFT_22249 [Fomitiporia mediterranea MF3/22]|uniref:uncharacterized protein n=1 Tax=Fomitiporia mediterranea (strain MF3/22) TaxID=694068 RepID=UPI000440777C|nr:uncharacterized protein FOMMEDRAFT_22249 [Fomitiporia mediterranea MF3/22]EJD00451.1 hypothetical protein FOMMEDRAFT_22249 [Fomitiporia mediterranea MF3/22]
MAATSQPISIARDSRSGGGSSQSTHHHHHHFAALSPNYINNNNNHLHPNYNNLSASPSSSSHHLNHHHGGGSGQPSLLSQHAAHLANPRMAGTSPRSAESSTSWAIHPGPLFVSAGSLGSTSGSLGAASMSGSAGSFRARMYPGCSPAAPLLNPLEPDFKFRGVAGSIESDHGSLINSHMSEREVEQYRDFTCCGLPLGDLHALVEHFETTHVLVMDPLNPHQHQLPHAIASQFHNATNGGNGSPMQAHQQSQQGQSAGDSSSLAGALGPSSSSSTFQSPGDAHVAPSIAHSGFDLDDMELDMDMELEPPETHNHNNTNMNGTHATSPAPSASSSNNSNPSTRSSPLGGGSGPLPLTQPQRFATANGIVNGMNGMNGFTSGTRSSVSSPPDTPLLTTPVSPFANANAAIANIPSSSSSSNSNTTTAFPWAAQTQDGLATPMASQMSSTQNQNQNQQAGQQQPQAPTGPSAFDNVHLPPKHLHGSGMFSHPYAGASSVGRRHPAHPLSPLSSASSTASSTPGTTSPVSNSGFAYPPGFGGVGGHPHGLHHTQSLYALRLARHAAEREEQLVKRALNGYAGYEDYSRGFPGTGDQNSPDVGIGLDGGLGGMGGGMSMSRMGSVGGVGGIGPTESAIHPGLLSGNANGANGGQVKSEPQTGNVNIGITSRTTPAHSRSGSPSSANNIVSPSAPGPSGSSTPSSNTNGTTRKPPQPSTTLSRPSSSLLLSKPFKCPTPGCTKSYKQANGLKYHVTHGQCSFTPPPELSSISELGLSIGVSLKLNSVGEIEGLENMSEAERREAEREAERRVRPFCCQVKPCQRRYKNMNGLRYHYQHSGEHGAVGLRMLASGRHDATRSQSVERSDEEEFFEESSGIGNGGTTGLTRSNSQTTKEERGRAKERVRKESHATSSAPSSAAPGPRQPTSSITSSITPAGTPNPFMTQPFAFSQQSYQHQRSLSGPGSPLSQAFPPPPQPLQQSFTSMSSTGNVSVGMNGNGNGNGFVAVVQSQPASAYASPWGSRAGSPTSLTAPGTWGNPITNPTSLNNPSSVSMASPSMTNTNSPPRTA